MKLLASLAVGAALFCGAAFAEDEISPARLTLAKEVMQLSGATSAYDNYEKNLDMMVAQLRRYLPGADDATMADVKRIAIDEFTAYKPTLLENAAAVYAHHFSEKDLKGLVSFYKTEAGKHYAAEMPALASESVKLTEPFTERFMAKLQEYIAKRAAAEQKKQDEMLPAVPPADKKKSPEK
ncbi:hypothetical protein FHS83_001313 [Rhizomicrobium palustre]|uniref:DUF2059 domain-containing protein n=1 Tax=Rhizomicrobium palustre TaxID=189966 RepID=A0A846MXP3_9PROT|nr:DUF2059 domain-containing protein [Rhizomicrobium palustre]NIK87995.1 hypothetical protein [Rhizomicrobium palustre]